MTVLRNPPWDRREVILACDLVADNNWRELRTPDPRVHELSSLLRKLSIHSQETCGENFRSPDSVSRKTTDLMTAHPEYVGARTKGGRITREVLLEFIADPAGMKATAASIRAAVEEGDFVQDDRTNVASRHI